MYPFEEETLRTGRFETGIVGPDVLFATAVQPLTASVTIATGVKILLNWYACVTELPVAMGVKSPKAQLNVLPGLPPVALNVQFIGIQCEAGI